MRNKHYALENGDITQVEPVGQESEDSDQLELLELEASVQNSAVESDTISMVMESLAGYAIKLESLIDDKTATLQTVDIIETAARDQLARVGETLELPAMEADGDVFARHQLVLESLKGAMNRIVQSYVVSFKHQWNAIADFFQSFDARLSKYEAKIDKTEGEYVRKKSRISENMTYRGNMVELWYHFVRDPMTIKDGKSESWGVKDPVGIAKDDVAMSAYLLDTYPKQVLAQLKSLDGFVRGATIKSPDDVGKLAKRVEGLKHPMELYDSKKLGTGHLLSAAVLEEEHGTVRQPVTQGKTTFSRLAELATPSKVIETWSGIHLANKIADKFIKMVPMTALVGKAIGLIMPNGYSFKGSDFDAMFKSARAYITNIKGFQKLVMDSNQQMSDLADHLEKLADQVDAGNFSGQDMREIGAVMRQIDMYAENLVASILSPAIKECSRSLKCVKYTNYLVLRMLSVAA